MVAEAHPVVHPRDRCVRSYLYGHSDQGLRETVPYGRRRHPACDHFRYVRDLGFPADRRYRADVCHFHLEHQELWPLNSQAWD